MYNVKGPSKILTKNTRRGISQNIDNIRDSPKNKMLDANDNEIINVPKPIFQQTNTRRTFDGYCTGTDACVTPQHEEIIKYIHSSWLAVGSKNESNCKKNQYTDLYYKDEPCQHLQDFKPFDLESWWGKRLYQLITNSVNEIN